MRAIGPGSVSSLLKIALDVVYVVLWVLIGALLVAALAALVIPIPERPLEVEINGVERELGATQVKLVLSALGACGAGYTAILLFVVDRVRRVFATLTAGDPFHPENVRRLQFIGLGLAAIEAANLFIPFFARVLLPGPDADEIRLINPTAWFSVLVVFVLAEVFREGARLRRDAELTI